MEPAERAQPKWMFPFFIFWIGQAFSLVGTQVAQFTLAWWKTELTGSATVLVSATLVATLAAILLGPFLGAHGLLHASTHAH